MNREYSQYRLKREYVSDSTSVLSRQINLMRQMINNNLELIVYFCSLKGNLEIFNSDQVNGEVRKYRANPKIFDFTSILFI